MSAERRACHIGNYHFEVGIISRKKKRSVIGAASYISGRTLHNSHNGKTYYTPRKDVIWQKIFLPINAPPKFRDLQQLCNEIEGAETRRDARTARQFIASLPNELPPGELVRIVHEFVEGIFVSYGLCVIAAIHRGHNADDPSKNNPHVHIIVPTRTVDPDGFCRKKDREHDKRKYINIWRKQWAEVQNRAYERCRLDIRVSHESLEMQGIDREPVNHLDRIDWQKEQRGERTRSGDRRRTIEAHNKERSRKHQPEREQGLDIELSR